MSDASTVSVRAVVAGHGTFASGVVSAVQMITGRGAVFATLSNGDLAADAIARAISDSLDENGARVVFTDLPAGSCTMAARRLMRERPELVLITGASVPMLLDFAMRDGEDPVAAARASFETARQAMAVHGAAA